MILRLNLKTVAALGMAALVTMAAHGQAQTAAPAGTGVLLLAHGGSEAWNARVRDVARDVETSYPTEVAFGMASRATIAAALSRLHERGVQQVVAVPLFVSSHSSVITSTEYLLGLRAEPPADLAIFAKMSHGHGGHGAGAPHHGGQADPAHARHADHAAPSPTAPIQAAVPVRMTPAFDAHAIVGAIVADRATAMSTSPAGEAVILVAHGPVPDDDNRRWLADMGRLAEHVRAASPFAAVEVITVRDDAGPALREAATQELRALVSRHAGQGRRVLVVPHLMAFGGIEQGIRTRLAGLDYTMAAQACSPTRAWPNG